MIGRHVRSARPIPLSIRLDELHHYSGRRSSSACAKNADAFRRISFARFNTRTSGSSSFIRCFSSVVRPARWPRSRSACRTHFRKVSAVQPIFEAIDAIAAHCGSYSPSCSNTIRTARSRTSGEYLFGLPMIPVLSRNGISGKPGAVQRCLFKLGTNAYRMFDPRSLRGRARRTRIYWDLRGSSEENPSILPIRGVQSCTDTSNWPCIGSAGFRFSGLCPFDHPVHPP